MARYLLTPFGSGGDVNPFIGLGKLLRSRGHEVEIITAPMFREVAEEAGLSFTGVGDAEEFEAIMHHPHLWKPLRGTALVFDYGGRYILPFYQAIAQNVVRGQTVIVAPFQMFAARLAREKLGVPLVNVHLQPACFLSVYDTPVFFAGAAWATRLPPWFKRLLFALPNPVAAKLMPSLRHACRELGVPPPKRPIPDWMHSPDANIALFPDWFAAPQPDWPPHTQVAGFPLEDLKGHFHLSPELQSWLAHGTKPVLLSPGTGNTQAKKFFQEGLTACKLLGLRALVGTRFPDQLPSPLPDHARHFEYLPFSEVLPYVSVLVHHGGIGTMSQGFAAGVPQLVMPMAHDQPDNAARMKKLDAGEFLTPRQFTSENIAAALKRLLSEADVTDACERLARLCKDQATADRCVEILEGVIPVQTRA
ncbi:glycosyltransferase [soil metagenome]